MRTTSTYFWRWNPELGQFRNLWRPSSSSISVFVKTSNRLSPPLPSLWWRPVPVVSPADLGINTNSCWEQELILKREGNTHIQCVLLNQLLRYSPPIIELIWNLFIAAAESPKRVQERNSKKYWLDVFPLTSTFNSICILAGWLVPTWFWVDWSRVILTLGGNSPYRTTLRMTTVRRVSGWSQGESQ